MPLTVMDLYLAEIEWRNPFEARNIDAKLVGVGSPLVVGIDAAITAEMMFGGHCVEAVGRELVPALDDFEILWRRRHGDCASHPANAAGAAPRRGKSLRQRHSEPNRPAVTRSIERHRFG